MKLDLKKIIIIIISITLIILIFIFMRFINKKGVFKNLFKTYSNVIIENLNYDTITGTAGLKSYVNSYTNDSTIISDLDSTFDYQVDLKNKYINIDSTSVYNNKKINSNIYLADGKINILTEDIYDKYIGYDLVGAKYLENSFEYKKILQFILDDLNYYLKNKYFELENVEFKNNKVNKLTFDMTSNNYKEIKKRFIKKVSTNEEIKKILFDLIVIGPYDDGNNNYDDLKWLKNTDFKNFTISLYMSKFSNDIVAIDYYDDTNKIMLEFDNSKIFFKIYVNDGFLYKGNFEIKNKESANKAYILNLINIKYNWNLNLNFGKVKMKYDKKVNSKKEINDDNSVYYYDMSDEDKNKIKEDTIIKEIYDSYLHSEFDIQYEPPEEIDNFDKENIA